MPNDLFSYENLNKEIIREGKRRIYDPNTEYQAEPGGMGIGPKGFIYLGYVGEYSKGENTETGLLAHKHGLKFHVSIFQNDLAKGWNVVKDVLIEEKVMFSKVAHENNNMAAGNGMQAGKDITISAKFSQDKDANFWFVLMERITQLLKDNHVSPGFAPLETGDRADKRLNGSNYITYRYDNWPPQGKDFCEYARITVLDQLPYLVNVRASDVSRSIELQTNQRLSR